MDPTPGLVVRYVPPASPAWLPPAEPGRRSCTDRAWPEAFAERDRPWLCSRPPGHDDDHASHRTLGTQGPALSPILARWPQEAPPA